MMIISEHVYNNIKKRNVHTNKELIINLTFIINYKNKEKIWKKSYKWLMATFYNQRHSKI